MDNQTIRFFASLVLVNFSQSATLSAPHFSSTLPAPTTNIILADCYKTTRNIGTFLGSLLLIETLFCCYVLYTWVRNFRINLRNKTNSDSPNEDANGDAMYADADEGTSQDKNHQKTPQNYQPLDPSPLSGPVRLEYQPLSKKRRELEKKPVKQFTERLIPKPNRTKALETTARASLNEEKDVGGLVYSQPYEDSVSAAAQLKIKGPGSFRRKTNKDSPQKEQNELPYYHVLEEDTQTNRPTSNDTPVKPLPFASKEPSREDVYYYCASDNPENKKAGMPKAASTKPLPVDPWMKPEDEVYYSCAVEEPNNKLSRTNSKKAILPFPQVAKEKSPIANRSVQQPYYHVLDNQSESVKQEPTNKSALKPLKINPMMNAHVIQEMKNRAAYKKSGD